MQFDLLKSGYVIDTKIAALKFEDTVDVIEEWARIKKPSYVCICNTHSLVTASNDRGFQEALDKADLCTPDGMPLVWALKMLGFKDQDRVDGPKLMLKLCENSILNKNRIFLFGSTPGTLEKMTKALKERYEGIIICGSYSPPFRDLTNQEEHEIVELINHSRPDIVFVGLGCPKQELWMSRNLMKMNTVMIGVGAAFDFISGGKKRPPIFFQRIGLEWLFRLISDPKRLWKRYAYNNPMFIYKFIVTFRRNKLRRKLTANIQTKL